jgi:hypothetical protein
MVNVENKEGQREERQQRMEKAKKLRQELRKEIKELIKNEKEIRDKGKFNLYLGKIEVDKISGITLSYFNKFREGKLTEDDIRKIQDIKKGNTSSNSLKAFITNEWAKIEAMKSLLKFELEKDSEIYNLYIKDFAGNYYKKYLK